jgi:hypothetical protein
MIGNYIKAAKAFLTSAKLMKTGQTTSYRTGDDGDLEVGRNVDFFTLAENNPFGNTIDLPMNLAVVLIQIIL